MQPLSYIERRVLDRLLEMDFQGAAQLRSQVAHIVGAERNCTCGCPSITPIIDRSVTAPALVYSTYLPVTLQEIDRSFRSDRCHVRQAQRTHRAILRVHSQAL